MGNPTSKVESRIFAYCSDSLWMLKIESYVSLLAS